MSARLDEMVEAFRSSRLLRDLNRDTLLTQAGYYPLGIADAANSLALLRESTMQGALARSSAALDLRASSLLSQQLDQQLRHRHDVDMAFSRASGRLANTASINWALHRIHGFEDMARTFELTRASLPSFDTRLASVQSLGWWREREHLQAFGAVSMMADMLRAPIHSALEFRPLLQMQPYAGITSLIGLPAHRDFLTAAGLVLPRWPRPLSMKERKSRLNRRIRQYAPAPHRKKAHDLIYQHELFLMEEIDDAMSREYGDDWQEQRLPICNCNDLFGKQRRRGGELLHNADYVHYERIMTHPEHYEAVFSHAFPDRDELQQLIKTAGDLRARTAHPARVFTAEDLWTLRTTWGMIKKALVAFEVMFAIDDD